MWVAGWGELPGHLVIVSGPSGSGKSTLVRRVLRRPDVRAKLSVSATTRAPRPGEVPGEHYDFLDRDEFQGRVERNAFLEWAEFSGNLYGTPAEPVLESLREGFGVILEIEVQGAMQVREKAPSALFVFIDVPRFWELEKRLRARGTEDDATIHRRLVRGRAERDEAHRYDVTIINDDLESAVDRLAALLVEHGCGGPLADAR